MQGALCGALAAVLTAAPVAFATTNNWVGAAGGGDGANWSDSLNWSAGVPGTGHAVTVTAGSIQLANETSALASFTMTGGTLTFANWMTRLRATEVVITNNAILTLPPAFTEIQMSNRVWIACSNLTLGVNAKIDTDSRGYASGQGPGKGGANGGAGHGGAGSSGQLGWASAGIVYDDVLSPVQPGSGGGTTGGSAGGGAIWIEASGAIAVHGLVSADAPAAPTIHHGGGSGGAISLACHTFRGSASGWIRARGGSGNNLGGPGGGGRIAVVFDPAAQRALAQPNPGVKFSLGPGTAGTAPFLARPGTLYIPEMEQIFLSGNLTAQWDGLAAHIPGFTEWSLDALAVAGKVDLPGLRRLHVTNNLSIASGGALALYSQPTNGVSSESGVWLDAGGALAVTGTLYLACNPTNGAAPRVTCGSLMLAANGLIDADGRGFAPEYGKGAGTPGSTSGAGHGGAGSPGNSDWTAAGKITGSPTVPVHPGSGGCSALLGAFGGGVVDIETTGDIVLFGTISANGRTTFGTHGGGGAGGSIRLRCRRLLGDARGVLRVQGGGGKSLGGPGGGGRLAVTYESAAQSALTTPNPGTLFDASAGTAGTWPSLAGHGTASFPDTLLLSGNLGTQWCNVRLVIPGCVRWEVNTLQVGGKLGFLAPLATVCVTGDVTVSSGGEFVLSGAAADPAVAPGFTFDIGGRLRVAGGGVLVCASDVQSGGSPWVTCGTLQVDEQGLILADQRGYAYGSGPAWVGVATRNGGGGYGGQGGTRFAGQAGKANGRSHAPVQPGSGGSSIQSGYGGGLVRIGARGKMTVDGSIRADGMGFKGSNGSGGAGGGILLTARAFAGAGSLLARGGGATALGRGGGGGRIAVWTPYQADDALNEMTANEHPPRTACILDPPQRWPDLTLSVDHGLDGTVGTTVEFSQEGSIFFATLPSGTLFMVR
jgi:hypothetical protein